MSRLLLTPILIPLRWYFKYVPDFLIGWLPVLVFFPNPQQTIITAITGTASAGIAEWADEGTRTVREFALRSAIALAVLTTASGLAFELVHPHSLSKVSVEQQNGEKTSAYFVAVNGGDAYLVENSRLTIVPATAYQRLVVTDSKTEESHSESIFNRLMP